METAPKAAAALDKFDNSGSNPDKTKSMAASIVAKMAAPEAEAPPAEGDADLVCQEMMEALQSNDVKSFRSALEAFLEMR